MEEKKWGFLRETEEDARRSGIEKQTGLCRTGLETYLKVIFPDVDDWIHDVPIGLELDGKKLRTRPDYRSETIMMIVEFDGIDHYKSPNQIRKDLENTEKYERLGYRVVRVPYFIQLTREAILTLFGVDPGKEMFDGDHPSLGSGNGDPASLCMAGIIRMAREFRKFPEQYETNLRALKSLGDEFVAGADLLEHAYLNDNLNVQYTIP